MCLCERVSLCEFMFMGENFINSASSCVELLCFAATLPARLSNPNSAFDLCSMFICAQNTHILSTSGVAAACFSCNFLLAAVCLTTVEQNMRHQLELTLSASDSPVKSLGKTPFPSTLTSSECNVAATGSTFRERNVQNKKRREEKKSQWPKGVRGSSDVRTR